MRRLLSQLAKPLQARGPRTHRCAVAKHAQQSVAHLVRGFMGHHGCDVPQVQQRACGAGQQGSLTIRDDACSGRCDLQALVGRNRPISNAVCKYACAEGGDRNKGHPRPFGTTLSTDN